MASHYGSYYEYLKETLDRYRGRFDPYILYLPEFFKVLAGLLKETAIDPEDRRMILAALGYLTAPSDVVPEEVYGPTGYVDDVYVCARVLDAIARKHGTGLPGSHWAHEEEFGEVLRYTLEEAARDLDKLGVRARVMEWAGLE